MSKIGNAAVDWAEKRAGKRRALIAFTDVHDAFLAGAAWQREQDAEIVRAFVHTRRDCEAGTTVDEIAELILASGSSRSMRGGSGGATLNPPAQVSCDATDGEP